MDTPLDRLTMSPDAARGRTLPGLPIAEVRTAFLEQALPISATFAVTRPPAGLALFTITLSS